MNKSFVYVKIGNHELKFEKELEVLIEKYLYDTLPSAALAYISAEARMEDEWEISETYNEVSFDVTVTE